MLMVRFLFWMVLQFVQYAQLSCCFVISLTGPPRKLCEVEGCVKVSVQGGRCISHGAKKNKFYIVALMFCTHSILSYDSLSITLCSYSHVQWKTVQNKQS